MPGKRGNGEGSIMQRPDGTWRGQLTLANGRKRDFRAKTQAEASAKLTRLTRERDMGLALHIDERLSVAAFLAGWLERRKPRLRASTHRRYAEQLAHILRALGRMRLTKLTASQVERVYADLLESGLSSTSVAHIHVVLKCALKDALRKGLVPMNVCDLVSAPREADHEIHPLDERAANAFLIAAAGERLEALFILALRTGIRQGELLALKWADVNLERGSLLIRASLRALRGGGYEFNPPKTKAGRRTIALSSAMIEALKAHRKRQNEERLFLGAAWTDLDLVFPSQIGTPLDARNLANAPFRRVLHKAGLPRI